MTKAPKIRCAIYTRKSSEEGLEQEFNSLDAQREACAAYVASQKGSGEVSLLVGDLPTKGFRSTHRRIADVRGPPEISTK